MQWKRNHPRDSIRQSPDNRRQDPQPLQQQQQLPILLLHHHKNEDLDVHHVLPIYPLLVPLPRPLAVLLPPNHPHHPLHPPNPSPLPKKESLTNKISSINTMTYARYATNPEKYSAARHAISSFMSNAPDHVYDSTHPMIGTVPTV